MLVAGLTWLALAPTCSKASVAGLSRAGSTAKASVFCSVSRSLSRSTSLSKQSPGPSQSQVQAPSTANALPSLPGTPAMAVAPRYLVLLDAAHGASETGARLSDHLLEKDFTLALSVRLRSTLTAHGIAVVTTRENDSDPAPNARAGVANRAHASACLLLHATTSGTGVHLYTSSLTTPGNPGSSTLPRPWATAQAPYLTQSLKLSSDLSAALGHAAIPVTLGSISLQPIDSMACPTVIVEVAPLLPRRGKGGLGLGDSEYQARVFNALTGALEEWRTDWKVQP